MIDEDKAAELRGLESRDASYFVPDMLATIEALWVVVRNAKRWAEATPGWQAIEAEDELMRSIGELS